MCYSINYRNISPPKKKMKISLSEEEAVEMAFFTEIPYDKQLHINEIQKFVHDVQRRPWFTSKPMSVPRIRSLLNDKIQENPRKNIEIDTDIYLFYAR